jgi:hypothetical protein
LGTGGRRMNETIAQKLQKQLDAMIKRIEEEE